MMINFFLKPTLEHFALLEIATTLWNQRDIRDLVRTFSNSLLISNVRFFSYPHYRYEKREEWKGIENKVRDNAAKLAIPESLKEKLLVYIQPLGIQILRWMECLIRFGSFDLSLLNNLCWTPYGTLDRKKTAEVLIKDEAIDITVRYKLACINCLEDVIPKLWFKIPESYKISFYKEGNIGKDFEKELFIFWKQYISRKETSKDKITERLFLIPYSASYMLRYAAKAGNVAATQYFLQKLIKQKHSLDEVLLSIAIDTAEKRREIVLHYTDPAQEHCSEVFYFLLSQINDEQQVQLFKACPIPALQCILDWPWQSFPVETVSRLFSFIPDSYDILKIIICKIDIGYDDYSYKKMFRNIWQLMTHSQKSHILNGGNFLILLNWLLCNKDEKNIEFIFEDITLAERKKFISSDMGLSFSEGLIYREKWDLLKFCVSLCTSSKDEIIKFKEKFQKYIRNKIIPDLPSKKEFERNRNKLEEFFPFLDDLVCGYDKRKSLDDCDNNSVKKLANIPFKE